MNCVPLVNVSKISLNWFAYLADLCRTDAKMQMTNVSDALAVGTSVE